MPCLKVEQTNIISITMPHSSSIGTPIYHFHAIRIHQKSWEGVSGRLQQVYKSKMLSMQANTAPNRVSYIQLFLISENNRYKPELLRASIIPRELELSDSERYSDEVLIEAFKEYIKKHPKKIQWQLKNLCI